MLPGEMSAGTAILAYRVRDTWLFVNFCSTKLCLDSINIFALRTVPTFVTAHTFCASWDTRISYGWCLLIQNIFLRGLKLCRESRTQQVLLVSKKKIVGNHAFFRDNKVSNYMGKKCHTLLCILWLFRITFCLIISKKCLVIPNFLFGFQ